MRFADTPAAHAVLRTGRRAVGVGHRVARAAAVVIGTLMALVAPAATLAASPAPTSAAIGDPRSSGQGPGLVGDPLAAILVVAAIAALALGMTLLYVKATGGRGNEHEGKPQP